MPPIFHCRHIAAPATVAFAAALKDSAVGEQLIADYLLYALNKNHRFEYVDFMKTDAPTDNVRFLLAKAAVAKGLITSVKNYEKGNCR